MSEATARSSTRLIWIDALKGLGAILVVLGHNPELIGQSYLHALIYSFHMPMFFAVTGLTLCMLTPRQWMVRMASLLWIYFMVSLIFIPFALTMEAHFIPTPEPRLLHILAGIAYGVCNSIRVDTLWFLPALTLGLAIAWPIIVLTEARTVRTASRATLLLAAALLCIAAGALLLGSNPGTPVLKQMAWAGAGSAHLWPWTANAAPFIAGFVILGRALVNTPRLLSPQATLIIGALFAFWLLAFSRSEQGLAGSLDLSNARIGPVPVWTGLAAIAGTAAFLLLLRRVGNRLMPLAWIGYSSLPIMVLHPMIQNAVTHQAGGSAPLMGLIAGILAPALMDRSIFQRHALGQLLFYPRNFIRKLRQGLLRGNTVCHSTH